MRTTVLLLTMALVTTPPAWQVEQPKKLTAQERTELDKKWTQLNEAGIKAYEMDSLDEAEKAWTATLEVARVLYSKTEYPDGHPALAANLNNLAALLQERGKLPQAERLFREALEIYRKQFKGDHPTVAVAINNLAALLRAQAKYAEAEVMFRENLEMRKRLHKGDHADIAVSLNNLAMSLKAQDKFEEAEKLLRESLAMRQRLAKGDNIETARVLNNLASLHQSQARYAESETRYRESLGMNRRLFKQDHPAIATSLNNLAALLEFQGRYTDAEEYSREGLEMLQRIVKGDHPYLATAMGNRAGLLESRGNYSEAEALYRSALEMQKQIYDDDHSDIAETLNNLGFLLRLQGRYAEAEIVCRDALTMSRRIFKDDHPRVARKLNNLAAILYYQGKFADAESTYKDSLAMTKRLFKGDHPDLAIGLANLAVLLELGGKHDEAERNCRDSLEMSKRLFKGDHPDVAASLGNLAAMLKVQRKYADAEPLFRDSLAMTKRIFKGDHHEVATSMNNLAVLLRDREKYPEADALFRESIAMSRRLLTIYAEQKPEGDVLTLLVSRPDTRSNYLGNAYLLKATAKDVYAEVMASKGGIGRIYEQRSLTARSASTSLLTAVVIAELTNTRRRRAELILAPESTDPTTQSKRDVDLKSMEQRIERMSQLLGKLLPNTDRAAQLAKATVAELQSALPADAVFVDFLGLTLEGEDKRKPGSDALESEDYSAFVVTKNAIKWIDLGCGAPLEKAVKSWRESITTPPFAIPADLPAKVRELVWDRVRKEFPAGTQVVYLSPDLALTRVPWSALPGDEPGKIVLEEFAIAVVPHALYLLDQLRSRESQSTETGRLLAVGGVPYDAGSTGSVLVALLSRGATTGNIPLKPGAKLQWPALTWTKGEVEMAARLAQRKKIAVELLSGNSASVDRVLADLPKARYAHFATHGFFADAGFQSVLQVDPKLFRMTPLGERIGAGARSPMTMSGLVFAGANKPSTRGRGLVTGDHLIDRDLSGLELAVLSACETGLGDVAGGEGVFGLQRAFHVAGCRNVVASLWKVDDAATAALMNEFYTQLWTQNQPPVIALQKAQLAIYRADPKDFSKIATRGIEEGTVDLTTVPVKKYPANPTKGTHPALWAAFTLSGVGR